MTQERQNSNVVAEKKGVKIYQTNPSIPFEGEISRSRRAQIGTDTKGLVVDGGTGEILGHGGAIVYEWEDVDKERFVKLYLAGLKQASGLTKAGLVVLELVYNQMRENPGKDTVQLSLLTCGIEKRAYYRGLRELLDKEFIFRSPYDGTFFVNIRLKFNGDRLAFVKGYRLRMDQPSLPGLELEQKALPAPDGK